MGNGHSIGRKSASQTDILVERAQRSRSENFPPGCPAISSPRDFRRTTSDLITQLREWEGTVIAKNSPPDAFNVVKLGTKCEKPLFALAFAVLRDVSEVLGLSMDKLAEFCLKVDSHMLENHYHNRLHVADVVQMFYLQTLEGGKLPTLVTPRCPALPGLQRAIFR